MINLSLYIYFVVDIEEHKDGGNEGLSNHADYDL